MNFQDISFLIASYLSICDGEIHRNEIDLQKILFSPSEKALEESQKILSDDSTKISLSDLTQNLKGENYINKKDLISKLFKIIYADGYYDSREKEFISKIAEEINFSKEEIVLIQNTVEQSTDNKYVEVPLPWTESLKQVFYALIYELNDKDGKYEGELLKGRAFVKKVKSIAERAKCDLEIAEKYMRILNKALEDNSKKTDDIINVIEANKRSDEESEELLNFIKEWNENTKIRIIENLSKNLEVLNKKKRTVDYFTIAFMGRSKAGKSTFHKVITGEETDDIGGGGIRTTRFNRVFNWENIRIIDTPGIGAPGGKSDTEIARSIVDEADLVCYIVTNDSIQETEFNFLKELKEKNKPLFIILNYKDNLLSEKHFDKFLTKPLLFWKEDTGRRSIKGHLDRIKEYTETNYNSEFIEIIPVHLQAALLSNSKKLLSRDLTELEINKLREGSNISEYTKKVKQTIFRSGNLKKSQNIIDGCYHQVFSIDKEIKKNIENLKKMNLSLIKKKRKLNDFITKEQEKTRNQIISEIKNTHGDMISALDSFANDHYDDKNINQSWNNFIKDNRYYPSLNKEIKTQIKRFIEDVKKEVEECFNDLNMEMRYGFMNKSIKVDTTDYKKYIRIGLSVMGIAIAILNPTGWVFLGVTIAESIISSFFSSKEKKIKKAIEKIKNSIKPNIIEQENKMIKEALSNFDTSVIKLTDTLNQKMDSLINGTKNILQILSNIEYETDYTTKVFNKILTYRVLEHLNIIEGLVKDTDILQELSTTEIERNNENALLRIKTPFSVDKKQQTEISKLLQMNVEFIK